MQKSSRERPIFKKQSQTPPGLEFKMDPQPEFDNKSAGSRIAPALAPFLRPGWAGALLH